MAQPLPCHPHHGVDGSVVRGAVRRGAAHALDHLSLVLIAGREGVGEPDDRAAKATAVFLRCRTWHVRW